ncbi:MAG: porin family protein [Alphaproteobacteria bacterium]|nr:porin family protein [Alphaproteobacteria bacterium]
MKKTICALLCMAPIAAYAEYGTYSEYDYDMDLLANCPACECNCADAASGKRDNYVGFRIYKNEHSTYSYTRSNGHKEKYSKDNFGFGSTVGNNLTEYLRVEYETLYMGAQYTKNDKDFEYDIWANMLNAYLLYDFDGAAAPYFGLGLGLTGIWGEVNGELDNAFDMSYQAMVGVLFRLNARIDLDVGFKYANFGKVEHSRGVSKVDATQLYIGAAYKFGL